MNIAERFRPGERRAGHRSLLCPVLVSLLLGFSDARAQSGAWTKMEDMLTPRAGGVACFLDGKIHFFGGMHSHTTEGRGHDVYDVATDSWQTMPDMPMDRGYPAVAVVDGIIYLIGGAFAERNTSVQAYDPATGTWTDKAPLLSARIGSQAGVVNGIIYNIGGNYTEKNCEAYDPRTNTWTRLKDRPVGGYPAVVVYNGLIYTFGGGGWGFPVSASLYVYDPKTNEWARKNDMPTARTSLQAFLIGGKIYVLGGFRQNEVSLPTVEVYDPATDTWQRRADMPRPNSYFAGAVAAEKIYVIGGTPDWYAGYGDLWQYDPAYHTEVAGGNASGVWTLANSPYHVNGEITIPNDSTLTIEPAVEVVFTGHYKLNVQGRLLAVGTQQDTIRFRAADTQTGWHGIRFDATPSTNDTSKAMYCSFKYGNANTGSGFDRCGGAMLIKDFDKVLVSHCLFDSNSQSGEAFGPAESGGAIKVYAASPTIVKSTFSNNTSSKASAMGCDYCPNVVITDNAFHNNRGKYGAIALAYNTRGTISRNTICNNVATEAAGGILVDNGSTPMIINNVIVHNQGFIGGILCYKGGKPVLMGNTITDNTASYGGGGIGCREDGDPVLINNILYGNAAPFGKEVALDDGSCDPTILYCDIEGGKAGIGGTGAGANYTGLYEHNIDADPLFVSAASGDYRLSDNSSCIGAGVDSVEVAAGVWYSAPPFCMGGNPRPSPALTKPDIGAYESLLGSPVVEVRQWMTSPVKFALHQNYPHPFNPSTTIRFELPKSTMVMLSVYDLLGREVSVLVNERRDAGVHEVKFDASELASGVYLYRLQAGDFVQSRKLIILR